MRKIIITVAAALATLLLLAGPASAGTRPALPRAEVIKNGCVYSGYGSPGRKSFTLHITRDTCGRSDHYGIRAAAECVTPNGSSWAYGPARYVGGTTSQASCGWETFELAAWGFQYEYRSPAPGHHIVYGWKSLSG